MLNMNILAQLVLHNGALIQGGWNIRPTLIIARLITKGMVPATFALVTEE